MLTITSAHRVHMACQAFDFRAGINGFVAICQRHFELDPFSGHCFIFRNRKKPRLRYCFTTIPVFGCVTKGYQRDNLNNGRHREVASCPWILSS